MNKRHNQALHLTLQGNRLEVIVIDISTDESKVQDRAYSNRDKLEARLDALLQQLFEMRD